MNGNSKIRSICELVEINRDDQALDVIRGNGHTDNMTDGDRHVFGLIKENCKLLNGFRYYDETRGWPLNPNAKRKKYLTLTELFAIKENLVAARDQELSLPAQRQIKQALQIVLAALGETESE